MREPPESHKQRFYKLPQLSWSWVATLIVYWGDFSSEGYYLHIRNSYTFKSSCWTSAFLWCCCLLLLPLANYRWKSFYPSQMTCGCETSMLVVCQVTICLQLEELATNCFSLVEKSYVAVSNCTRAIPFIFCPIGKILSSPLCWCVWGSRCLSVKIFLRQCVSFGPYVCWNMLSYASIICWSSLRKEGKRG